MAIALVPGISQAAIAVDKSRDSSRQKAAIDDVNFRDRPTRPCLPEHSREWQLILIALVSSTYTATCIKFVRLTFPIYKDL